MNTIQQKTKYLQTHIIILLSVILVTTIINLYFTVIPKQRVLPRAYQLELNDEGMYLYDDNKLIGVLPYDSSALDLMITEDNM